MYFTKPFSKGSVIFEENSKGNSAFVIVSGRVEISKRIGDKQVILDVMDPGCVFGEMALLGTEKRTATARAIEHTELIVINKSKLLEFLDQSPPILKTIIFSLVQRLASTNERIRVQASDNLYLSVCGILSLMFKEKDHRGQIPYPKAIENIKSILSISLYDCEVILNKLHSLNLIDIQQDKSGRRSISLVDSDNFQDKYGDVLGEFSDALPVLEQQRTELMDINDLAKYIGVEPKKIYRKIAYEEFPESLFFFKREAVLQWADEKGKEFFERTKKRRISADEVEDIRDILYVDNATLRLALSKIGDYKVSLLLRLSDEEVQKKILSNLPKRIRELVMKEMETDEWVDETETEDAEHELIEALKSVKKTPGTEGEETSNRKA